MVSKIPAVTAKNSVSTEIMAEAVYEKIGIKIIFAVILKIAHPIKAQSIFLWLLLAIKILLKRPPKKIKARPKIRIRKVFEALAKAAPPIRWIIPSERKSAPTTIGTTKMKKTFTVSFAKWVNRFLSEKM